MREAQYFYGLMHQPNRVSIVESVNKKEEEKAYKLNFIS